VTKRLHVALLIESSRGYGRGLLHGIAEYVRGHGLWSIYVHRHHLYDAPPDWLRDWRGDGIIARVENQKLARAIRARKVPAVDLRGRLSGIGMPAILTDDEAGARMAADHLVERGFRQFAYCGFVGTHYSDERSHCFRAALDKAGFPCSTYQPPRHLRGGNTEKMEQQGLIYEEDLARWLAGLPKPVGLMACNDARGHQVLNACRELGIAVPDEVAVLGVDNDDVVCDLCDPPLSSVVPNTQRIGYEAAVLLDKMMAGEAPPEQTIYISPLNIVTRRSTDVLAIEDPDIAAAVRLIRERACSGLTVEDLLAQVPLSADVLERRFQRLLGRTPKAEIVRVQLQRVKQLLGETELSLKQVAVRAGFTYTEYMSAVFKCKTGVTPGRYRAQARQGKYVRQAVK
jgi:LacI family transcriptional regulator